MTISPKLKTLLTLSVLGITAGCFSRNTGTVEGRVLLDGQPKGGFEIAFTSVDSGFQALGAANVDGAFRLYRARGKQDIPIGEYKVTVTPSSGIAGVDSPNVKLPATVTDTEQTILVKTVRPGRNTIDLDLASAK